ncbi:MAG TPA: gluconeogenesis factor YvcK family protein [Pyrinomonadaceae bacterium]|nr:gluconeogenesis factor YvcK family protein [Pyrinomonadaceae bacterium]
MHESNPNASLKIVAIGGGTGLSTLLAGLKRFVGEQSEAVWIESLSGVVTVSDDGGSSGRLRDELQMLPPGDIRNCMIALSEDSNLLSRLFRYRFGGAGDLAGHSFGNLFLAALTEVTGDFVEAVRLSSEVLASKGHIFPATTSDVRLVAELEDGREVHGESQITGARSHIRHLRLVPDHCLPLPETLAAIESADIITIGPGSLYTSIVPNLLVRGVAEAIGEATATKIFVSNLMTQPGETDDYGFRDHLDTIREYAPQIRFDYAIVNDRPISRHQAELYRADGAHQILLDENSSSQLDPEIEVVRVDLLDEGDMVRHNTDRLARVVMSCAANARERNLIETELLAAN